MYFYTHYILYFIFVHIFLCFNETDSSHTKDAGQKWDQQGAALSNKTLSEVFIDFDVCDTKDVGAADCNIQYFYCEKVSSSPSTLQSII